MASDPARRRPLVTISAPYGTGGSVIAPELAERLGVPFVDRAIPVSVSKRLDIPVDDVIGREEIPHDTLTRWAAYFAPAVQLFGGMALNETSVHDDQTFRIATEEALREHAEGGAVILGRAGALVLRDVPHALHVRLSGTRERRLEGGMRFTGADRQTAEQELRASDLAREAYVKDWYRADPADPEHYHLVIDSTRLPVNCCLEMILVAVHRRLQAASVSPAGGQDRTTSAPGAPLGQAASDPDSGSA